MSKFPVLAVANTAAHMADQILLAAIPVLLVASGATAGEVGLAVALQSAAWLVMSMPSGALADRMSRRSILAVGAALIMAGAGLAWLTTRTGRASALPIGLAGFLVSAGVVLQVLSVFALLPRFVGAGGVARSNAILEFGRAVVVLTAPLAVGWAVTNSHGGWPFLVALGAGAVSLAVVLTTLGPEAPQSASQSSLLQSVRDGAMFVVREPILRAIAFCAIAWNAAFFALTAAFAPYVVSQLQLPIGAVTNAWSAYGVGLLLGAAVAPYALKVLPTWFLFLFGPVSSLAGTLFVVALGPKAGALALQAGLFTLGFGPMLWLVLQTSVRQILTPPDLLGRVAATISTAIYGVRPIGALIAGWVGMHFGPYAALWLATGLFGASIIAIAASPAVRMRRMPTQASEFARKARREPVQNTVA